MKLLPLSLLVLAIAGGIAPAAVAGQQVMVMEGQKARPDPVVPSVPVQETPIVLAQTTAPNAGATQQPDYILKDCQETLNGGDSNWAVFGVDPAGSLAVYIGNRDNRDIYGTPALLSTIKVTLLEETRHGELTAEVDNNGNTSYRFDPEPGYLGKDRAVFMAEFEGKRYKIVIDLVVGNSIDEYNPVCPKPQLIKVTKPSSSTNGYDLNSIGVTFADLQGAALGQTVGSTITLDTTAAGNGWFIDTTPGQNNRAKIIGDTKIIGDRPRFSEAGQRTG